MPDYYAPIIHRDPNGNLGVFEDGVEVAFIDDTGALVLQPNVNIAVCWLSR